MLYFIYNHQPDIFTQINNKAQELYDNNHEIFYKIIDYDDYKNNTVIQLYFKQMIFKLTNKYVNHVLMCNEFNKYNTIIIYKIKSNLFPLNIQQFKFIYDTYFKNINFKNEIYYILKTHYPYGFKLTYDTFLELYQLQPELFNYELEKYFNNDFKNYDDNILKVKEVYNEFHNLYPNSSFQGTKYHTNVMICRNQFLKDYNEFYKFFSDDDDFTCGLDNYVKIYDTYKQHINEYFKIDIPIYKDIIDKIQKSGIKIDVEKDVEKDETTNETLKNIERDETLKNIETTNETDLKTDLKTNLKTNETNKNNYTQINTQNYILNLNDINKFRKFLQNILIYTNIYNIYIKYLYMLSMKIYMFESFFVSTDKHNLYKIHKKSFSMCNKIIPPYLPFNFTSIQESASEDCIFIILHYSNILMSNVFNFDFNTYYYFDSTASNYLKLSKASNFVINRVYSINLMIGNIQNKYTLINCGRYYFKFDSIVEFVNNKNKEELRFVCDRKERKIKINDVLKVFKDYNDWNNKISNECLGVLY